MRTICPRRGVLFVDCQGLGDVVQSLPLLKAVCNWAAGKWPVRVLFASPQHYELVREENLQLIPILVGELRRDPAGLLNLWTKLAGKSDLIVCAPEMSAAKLVLLRYVTGARYAVGEASSPYGHFLTFYAETSWTEPYLETADKIAAVLGSDTPLEPPAIRLMADEISWAGSEVARAGLTDVWPLIGIQCSSAVPSKRWPAESFSRVIQNFREECPGLGIVSFGNAAERETAGEVLGGVAGVPWLEGTGRWSIRETLAMLSRCDIFISGDTGLMHMAAAVKTRTVSIFGPTSAARRAPRSNSGIALCPATACHPCFRGRWTPCDCIRQISPGQVSDAAKRCLKWAARESQDKTGVLERVGA
ncbi:MAG: glycosyltransferase family 9 protein [Candidatus Acidiferrales bacterium]